MTEEEARAIMRTYHWTFKIRWRGRETPYLYAARKQAGKLSERYICPLSHLERLTEAELRDKLI